jgi:regulatory protein
VALVTEVVAPYRGSRWRDVWVDGALWRTTSSDVVRAVGVRKGLKRSDESLTGAIDEEEPLQARARAFRLLAYRERSSAELRDRLVSDGYPASVALALVGDLQASGLVDDARYTEVAARTLVDTRRFGRERARRELIAKGVDEDRAREALDAALTPEAEEERALFEARSLAARPAASFERIARRLTRKGYSASLAVAATRRALDEAADVCDGSLASDRDGPADLQ